VYISFRRIRHRLIRQFAQFFISFYPREAFCSGNTSFAVSLLMSKQLTRVGISNKLRIFIWELLHLAICSSTLCTRCKARPDTPLRERRKSSKFIKDLKGVRFVARTSSHNTNSDESMECTVNNSACYQGTSFQRTPRPGQDCIKLSDLEWMHSDKTEKCVALSRSTVVLHCSEVIVLIDCIGRGLESSV